MSDTKIIIPTNDQMRRWESASRRVEGMPSTTYEDRPEEPAIDDPTLVRFVNNAASNMPQFGIGLMYDMEDDGVTMSVKQPDYTAIENLIIASTPVNAGNPGYGWTSGTHRIYGAVGGSVGSLVTAFPNSWSTLACDRRGGLRIESTDPYVVASFCQVTPSGLYISGSDRAYAGTQVLLLPDALGVGYGSGITYITRRGHEEDGTEGLPGIYLLSPVLIGVERDPTTLYHTSVLFFEQNQYTVEPDVWAASDFGRVVVYPGTDPDPKMHTAGCVVFNW